MDRRKAPCTDTSSRAVFQEFVKKTNYDVEHVIKKEMSGDVRDAFVAIGESILRHT